MKRVDSHTFKGMQRDMDPLIASANLLYDAHNIRLTSRDKETFGAISNEQGTTEIELFTKVNNTFTKTSMKGFCVGQCVVGEYLVVFTHDEDNDRIYRIIKSDNYYLCDLLFEGDINLQDNIRLETLGVVESSTVNKVYWVDGINLPRVINVTKDKLNDKSLEEIRKIYKEQTFDFVPTLSLKDSIRVKRSLEHTGSFPGGTIQYAISYYNKYGQESALSYITPLYYTGYSNRAASAEEYINNAFYVEITNPDPYFDYVRLYSIFRTSLNATPIVKKVKDVQLQDYKYLGSKELLSGTYLGKQNRLLVKKDTTISISTDGGSTWLDLSIDDLKSNYSKKIPSSYSASITVKLEITGAKYGEKAVVSEVVADMYGDVYKSQGINKIIFSRPDNVDNWILKVQGIDGKEKLVTFTEKTNSIYLGVNEDNLIEDDYGNIFSSCLVLIGSTTGNDFSEESTDPEIALMHKYNTGNYEPTKDGWQEYAPEKIEDNQYFSFAKSLYLRTRNGHKEWLISYNGNGFIFITDYYESDMNIYNHDKIEIIDTNTTGEVLDSTALLYIGGEDIIGSTIEAKDGTFFIGNLKVTRPTLPQDIRNSIYINKDLTTKPIEEVSRSIYYPNSKNNEINSYNSNNSDDAYKDFLSGQESKTSEWLVNPSTFKSKEYYRLGIQFQYKNGRWSAPIYIEDYQINTRPINELNLNSLNITFDTKALEGTGYKRARAMVVTPSIFERNVIVQGIACPTVKRNKKDSYFQSSWFYRPMWFTRPNSTVNDLYSYNNTFEKTDSKLIQEGLTALTRTDGIANDGNLAPSKRHEIQGIQGDDNFKVYTNYFTINSPDLEFSEEVGLLQLDASSVKTRVVGASIFTANYGDINVGASSPISSKDGTGFYHYSQSTRAERGFSPTLCSTFAYRDAVIGNNNNPRKEIYNITNDASASDYIDYLIYPWQRSGSLNNDYTQDGVTRTAVLQTKIISNLKYSSNNLWFSNVEKDDGTSFNLEDIELNNRTNLLFNSSTLAILKPIPGVEYYGNIDTALTSEVLYGAAISNQKIDTTAIYQLKIEKTDTSITPLISSGSWSNVSNYFNGQMTEPSYAGRLSTILMRYKSSPHIISVSSETNIIPTKVYNNITSALNASYFRKQQTQRYRTALAIVELYRDTKPSFGGNGEDDNTANEWLPAGDITKLDDSGNTTITYKYGDTYYQRFDCLKTYPYTTEDENQIVEIASFLCESRVNPSGRWDRNRGLLSNLYVDNSNFNKHNPVYSQRDNYFTYNILDKDYDKFSEFPNTIAFSLNKRNFTETDPWTRIDMTSVLELNGANGAISAIRKWNDTLYAFQEKAINQVLANSRVQIPASDGVPIEIANSDKVEGYREFSNTLGCINKESITRTPMGLTFVDTDSKEYYLLNDKFDCLSKSKSMSTWFKKQDHVRSWYDSKYNDLYIQGNDYTLNYNFDLQEFVSFFDYNKAVELFNNWEDYYALTIDNPTTLHSLFTGDYNYFFEEYKPFSIEFYSNNDPQLSKTYTNAEARLETYAYDNVNKKWKDTERGIEKDFFNKVDIVTAYQEIANEELHNLDIKDVLPHYANANVKNKFRIWRVNLPREKTLNTKLSWMKDIWARIKFEYNKEGSKNRMVLHNIDIINYI